MTDLSRVATFADLSGGAPIVVLAPHPDDESLGCGALLHAAFAGPGARVICMTDGSASHPNSPQWPKDRLAKLRARELDAAITALGGDPACVTRLGLPDAGMPKLAEQFDAIAQRIADVAQDAGAETLFAPAPTDPHCDHEATAEIADRVARRTGLRLLHYPVWSYWNDKYYRRNLPHRVEHRLPIGEARAAKAGCSRSTS